jgi:hypothetical protein
MVIFTDGAGDPPYPDRIVLSPLGVDEGMTTLN